MRERYVKVQGFKQNIGTKTIISNYFDHKNTFSRHAETLPPGYRNLQKESHRLRGSRDQKEQLKKQTCLDSQPMFLGCSILDELIVGATM